MKTKLILGLLLAIFAFTNTKAQDPFQMYKEKDLTWKGAIYKMYIKQYAGIDVNQVMLDGGTAADIKSELIDNSGELTEDMDKAISAQASGKKVFFFIENAVWGGLETGTTFSGSWQKKFPMVSGFYLWTANKCFQNEGLNYHSGTKEKNHKVEFIIINK